MVCVKTDTFCDSGSAQMKQYGVITECMGTPTFETNRGVVSKAVNEALKERKCDDLDEAEKLKCNQLKKTAVAELKQEEMKDHLGAGPHKICEDPRADDSILEKEEGAHCSGNDCASGFCCIDLI